jgi:NitT/TauT family transport system substrate-binding protein
MALTLAVGALASSAHAADKLSVGKAAQTSSAIMPIDVGVKAGLFEKRGLDIEIVNFAGSAKMHQTMLSGNIDIGIGGGPEMALVAKGAPELAVCNAVPKAAFVGLTIGADSDIHTIADLKGKKIAVGSIGGLTYWLALEMARKEGWAMQDISIVEIGNDPASTVAMLRTHGVDASYTATALSFVMEDQKSGRLLVPASAYEGNIGAGVIFATQRVMSESPDTVRRFLAGWLDTIAYLRDHKAETVAVERAITGFPEDAQAREYDLTRDMFSSDCKFDAESIASIKRSFADLKTLNTPPDMATLYTEKYLP